MIKEQKGNVCLSVHPPSIGEAQTSNLISPLLFYLGAKQLSIFDFLVFLSAACADTLRVEELHCAGARRRSSPAAVGMLDQGWTAGLARHGKLGCTLALKPVVIRARKAKLLPAAFLVTDPKKEEEREKEHQNKPSPYQPAPGDTKPEAGSAPGVKICFEIPTELGRGEPDEAVTHPIIC